MRKFIAGLLVVLAFGWAGSASAIPITDTVFVDGREWAQTVDFVNNTWYDIAEVCDHITGACNGALNGYDMAGWTWANADDTYALLANFSPDGEVAGACRECAEDFWAAGFKFVEIPPDDIRATIAFSRTTNFAYSEMASGIYLGTSTDYGNPYYSAWNLSKTQSFEVWGGAFYREVSTAATLPLLGIGLAALGYSRRKLKQHA